ncbi:hypothetical protein OsJ_34741 [Oryza sativa Japonica Group]|uniref:Uncharacterized protein n=1 Tax=Oryza sativa subsp. japonica TaxID=39947 RepID=B9G8R1_ORYSJ|nr:hypothetical protein OsJ_34741 [Oryza sativa Japonica Group]
MGEADREGGNGAEGGHGSTCVGARAIAHDGEGGGSDDSSRNDDNGYHDSNPLPSTAWRPRPWIGRLYCICTVGMQSASICLGVEHSTYTAAQEAQVVRPKRPKSVQ